MSKEKSFTLIELLVVIAVIGLLSSVVLVQIGPVRERARIAKAREEVNTIFTAITTYWGNTEEYPHSNNIDTADGFKACCGSYSPQMGNDPWGQSYFYDGCPEPCGSCSGSGWDASCETGLWQTSVCSGGPDKTISSHNVSPNGDDICIYFNGGPSW